MANETKIVITAATAQAEAALKSFTSQFQGMLGVVSGALSVGAFAGLIKSSIDLQDEFGSLSAKTGITAKDFGGLKYLADQNGTSLEMVSKAIKELSVNMSSAPDKFAKLGINATNATDALAQISDLVATMPDGMQKTALLAELMGKKVGPEMAELMSIGGNAMRDYIAKGQDIYKVADENSAKAKEFKDQMAELQARVQGVGIALSSNLLPGLSDTAKAMNDLATKGHPVLALWHGFMGMSKVPWDLFFPPENLKKSMLSTSRIQELQNQLQSLNEQKDHWLNSDTKNARLDAEIARINAMIEGIKKHAAELDKMGAGQDKPKTTPAAVTDLLRGKVDQLGGIKEQKNGLEVLRALERDYQNELAKRKDALNAPLLSAGERQLADDLRAVHKRAQDARVALENQNASQGLSQTEYSARLSEVTAKELEQAAAVKELQAAQDQLNQSFSYGAKTALRQYLDEVENTAKQSNRLMSASFKGMEDTLAKFFQTGKLDMKGFADSIIAELARIAAQKAIAGLLGSMFGGGGGIGQGQGMDTAGITIAPPGRASGGPVSANSLYRINERGPEIFNQGGNDYLMMGGKGGFVKPLGTNTSVAGSGGASINYSPTIQIDARSDQAQVEQLVSRAVRQGNAELVDRLQRQGAI